MLRQRLLSAAFLIGGLIVLIVLDAKVPIREAYGLWMLPAAAVFVGGTALELSQLLAKRWPVNSLLVVCMTMLVFLSAAIPLLYPLMTQRTYPANCPIGQLGFPLLSCLVATSVFAVSMLRSEEEYSDRTLATWALSSLVPLYVGAGASFWIAIRLIHSPHWSLLALIGVITVTKLSDSGAYFVGRAMGRTKMCPRISPGKTIEGAVGGILASVIASYLWFHWLMPWAIPSTIVVAPVWGACLLGLLLAVTGILGDLVESVVKRSVGIKDSGQLLPGLGGVWDVTDSLLPTAVAGYVGIVAGLVGKG